MLLWDMVIAFPIYMCECVVVNCTCSVLVMHYIYVTLFSVMKYAKKELEEKDFVIFTEKKYHIFTFIRLFYPPLQFFPNIKAVV